MAHFPLFVNLEGLPCTVIGCGVVGLRKIETLLGFGARVTAFDGGAADVPARFAEMGEAFTLVARDYQGPADLARSRLVVAATDDKELNRRVSFDAKALGILVNVADDPVASSFFFPAIVRRGDLVAGLSSSGRCPRFIVRLRNELEKLWPSHWGRALETLAAERETLRAEGREVIPVMDERIDRLFNGESL